MCCQTNKIQVMPLVLIVLVVAGLVYLAVSLLLIAGVISLVKTQN